MQTLVELFIIEMGMSAQPFKESFHTCHHWVTPSWFKSIWEKASTLDIEIELAQLPLQPPREYDSWLMAEFACLDFDQLALKS